MIAITLSGKWVFDGFADRYKLHAARTLCATRTVSTRKSSSKKIGLPSPYPDLQEVTPLLAGGFPIYHFWLARPEAHYACVIFSLTTNCEGVPFAMLPRTFGLKLHPDDMDVTGDVRNIFLSGGEITIRSDTPSFYGNCLSIINVTVH
jgi:hypothetical protein